ncbi:MAG: hypothetical protein KR126chlam4_01364, partial [Candidatus Anoxychlamydiales bacterium]|nr:hypothetical protein [Candidatus Anoxychlamydiales bacterium]
MAIRPNSSRNHTFQRDPHSSSHTSSYNQRNLAETVLQRLIDQRGRNTTFQDFNTIKRLPFEQAFKYIEKNNFRIDNKIYHQLIRSIKKTDRVAIDYLNYFLQNTPTTIKGQCIKNSYFYNSIIGHGKKNINFFPIAKKAFEEAKRNRFANVVTYNGFIDAAGKNGEFREAKVAFEEAKRNRFADVVTYNGFIDAAGKNGKFREAKDAFEEAKGNRFADVVTYNGFIDAAGKNGKFREAKVAFEEAKGNRFANVITYNGFIDAAGKNGEFREAKVAFEEAKGNRFAN